jgi:predicted small metal-binding protein
VDSATVKALMKQFACGDVVPGCQARFVCSDEEEVLAQVAAHAAEAHGLTDLPPALITEVRSRILAVA